MTLSERSEATGRAIFLAIVLVIAAQFYLVFNKAINWDEFLHYSIVFDLPRGRVVWVFQTIMYRFLDWIPLVAPKVIDGILVARLVMLACEIAAMIFIVLLARKFVDRQAALLAGLLYVSGGFVFLHGFSLRPDPFVAALLMGALYVLAIGRLTVLHIVLAGFLVGLAGMSNMKAIFYAPAFAGVAYLVWHESEKRGRAAFRLAMVPLVAAAVFTILYLFHSPSIASEGAPASTLSARMASYVGGDETPRYGYSLKQFLIAPVLTIGILLLSIAWRGQDNARRLALVGLLLPLSTLLFYRNTFPYYFVFILPPICVAISPSLAWLARRYNVWLVAVAIVATPAALLVSYHDDVLQRQRLLLSEIDRLYPQETGYLAYTGTVSHYPRVIPNLISGVGLKRYHQRGEPVIARAIERGETGFVIDDHWVLSAALRKESIPRTLLAEDFAQIGNNFIRYSGPIWVYGKQLCRGQGKVELYRSGPYTFSSDAVVDGREVAADEPVEINRGTHVIEPMSARCVKLWNLAEPFTDARNWPEGRYTDGF